MRAARATREHRPLSPHRHLDRAPVGSRRSPASRISSATGSTWRAERSPAEHPGHPGSAARTCWAGAVHRKQLTRGSSRGISPLASSIRSINSHAWPGRTDRHGSSVEMTWYQCWRQRPPQRAARRGPSNHSPGRQRLRPCCAPRGASPHEPSEPGMRAARATREHRPLSPHRHLDRAPVGSRRSPASRISSATGSTWRAERSPAEHPDHSGSAARTCWAGSVHREQLTRGSSHGISPLASSIRSINSHAWPGRTDRHGSSVEMTWYQWPDMLGVGPGRSDHRMEIPGP